MVMIRNPIAALLLSVAATAMPVANAAKVLSYPAQPANTGAVGDWYSVGTVAFNPVTLMPMVIGDYLGYDFSDSDGDGNPQTLWFNSPFFYDGEVLLAKYSGTADISLDWDGCIGGTYTSYHFVGLAATNSLFSGMPGSFQGPVGPTDISFMARWEMPGRLVILRHTSPDTYPIDLSIASPNAAGDFCGSFRVERVGTTVSAYFNGTLVYSGASLLPAGTPMMAVAQSFDRPITVTRWNYTVEDVDATPPVIVSATPSTASIWPPNKKMVPVNLLVDVTDDSGSATVGIDSIEIWEVGILIGTSATSSDAVITGPSSVSLRATRPGQGERIYRIAVRATDPTGNSTIATVDVAVPHNQ